MGGDKSDTVNKKPSLVDRVANVVEQGSAWATLLGIGASIVTRNPKFLRLAQAGSVGGVAADVTQATTAAINGDARGTIGNLAQAGAGSLASAGLRVRKPKKPGVAPKKKTNNKRINGKPNLDLNIKNLEYNKAREAALKESEAILAKKGVRPLQGEYYQIRLEREMSKRGYGRSDLDAAREARRIAAQNKVTVNALAAGQSAYDVAREQYENNKGFWVSVLEFILGKDPFPWRDSNGKLHGRTTTTTYL